VLLDRDRVDWLERAADARGASVASPRTRRSRRAPWLRDRAGLRRVDGRGIAARVDVALALLGWLAESEVVAALVAGRGAARSARPGAGATSSRPAGAPVARRERACVQSASLSRWLGTRVWRAPS
jgi:hypothetical protein